MKIDNTDMEGASAPSITLTEPEPASVIVSAGDWHEISAIVRALFLMQHSAEVELSSVLIDDALKVNVTIERDCDGGFRLRYVGGAS